VLLTRSFQARRREYPGGIVKSMSLSPRHSRPWDSTMAAFVLRSGLSSHDNRFEACTAFIINYGLPDG